MEERQFKQLCQACDNILLDKSASIERLALPCLHVIREHPVFLKEYEVLFEDKPISRHIKSFSVKLLWNNITRLIMLLFHPTFLWHTSKKTPYKTDILFVSHLLKDSHAGDENDFYFGDLADKLYNHDVKSAYALINHTQISGGSLVDKWRDAKTPRYILSELLGFRHEVIFYFKSLWEAGRLKKNSKTLPSILEKKIAYKAAYELRHGSAIPNLRIKNQIRRLVLELRPELLVVTYEGHAWERIVFAEARKINPNIRCLGYQHAAIFYLQHAIRRSLGVTYDPDSILTAGIASYNQLLKSSLIANLSILGSYRGLDSGIRYKKQVELVCLVIPEGFISECVKLFSFSLACAIVCPQINFIWRLHPLISYTDIQKYIDLEKLPKNITLSSSKIEDDIRKSKWALYRGTTAIIQAVKSELIPIYYDDGGMVIDALYEIINKNLYIKTVSDFKDNISEMAYMSIENETKNIRDYVNLFFVPFDHTVLLDELKLIRTSS